MRLKQIQANSVQILLSFEKLFQNLYPVNLKNRILGLLVMIFIPFLISGQGSLATKEDFQAKFKEISPSSSPKTVANEMIDILNQARHVDITIAEGLQDTIISYILANDLKLVEGRYYTEVAEIWRVKNRLDLMIDYYNKTINIYKEFQQAYPDSSRYEVIYTLSGCYNNLADGYILLGKYKEALNFYKISLASVLPLNDSLQNSIRYYNISDTYVALNKPDSAMKYILLCKKMEDGMGMPDGLAYAHDGLAEVHLMNGDFEWALAEIDTALAFAQQVNDPFFHVEIQQQKAEILMAWKKFELARDEYLSIQQKSQDIGYEMAVEDSYAHLKEIYSELGDYQSAFKYADLLLSLADSTLQEKAAEKALEFEIMYQTEMKDAEIENLNKQKELTDKLNTELKEKRELEANRSRIINIALICGLVLLSLIGGILFRNSRKNAILNLELQRSNAELSEKNEEIQDQAAEINDSISYAMNIQGALFPNEKELGIVGEERFVLFSPKDIVSGDFFWTFRSERLDLNYLAVADCTGHGVPGAFMSILGISLLDKVVIKLTDLNTDTILNELNHELYKNLSAGGQYGVRDGMDIALISIDSNEKKFSFSGARNRVIHISHEGLNEYKGDRVDLGRVEHCKSIQKQVVHYETGDMIYLFTDGYVDQKGSETGKKFYMEPFRELLLKIAALPVKKQQQVVEETFHKWKGQKYDQMDDILVVGIRL